MRQRIKCSVSTTAKTPELRLLAIPTVSFVALKTKEMVKCFKALTVY